MGTRSDYWIGRGLEAEWLGSLGWDGHPESVDPAVLKATDEQSFRAAVKSMLTESDDGTTPEMGWAWPWADSCLTDYAYAFDNGRVWASCFGHTWFDPNESREEDEENGDCRGPREAVFPNMTSKKNVTLGPRSGLIVFGG